MKIQTVAIIFILITLPISILLSNYVKGEIKIIEKQNRYDVILNNATYDAVKAFKLNTVNNNKYSSDKNAKLADSLKRDIKASINAFMNSISTNLGLASYEKSNLKTYIPALAYILYDGMYIYTPTSVLGNANNYEHIIRPYIYYSMKYVNGNDYIIINYTLDNYIAVYGMMNGKYIKRAGYLEYLDAYGRTENSSGTTTSVSFAKEGNSITITEEKAIKYYENAHAFTEWVKTNLKDFFKPENARKIGSNTENYIEFDGKDDKFLEISSLNDPEKEDSSFNMHRKEVIRLIIQDNLNSAFESYDKNAEDLGNLYNFKMPMLSPLEWERLTDNISLISFFQGLPLGNKYYNGYSMIECDRNNEYKDKDDIYYVTDSDLYYHRLDCKRIRVDDSTKGYPSVNFEKKIVGNLGDIRDPNSPEYDSNKAKYIYDYDNNGIDDYDNNGTEDLDNDGIDDNGIDNQGKLACYYCIINSNYTAGTLDSDKLNAKYTAIGKMRYETPKRADNLND